MAGLSKAQVQEKRSLAQKLAVTMQVGKNGITDATIAELAGQLKSKKLVKVRLLPAATGGGDADDAQAQKLAEATKSILIEVRGHTAVYFRQ